MFGFLKNFGRYPAEYNEKIHGPYDPSVYYGKKDTPFGEVKVGELGAWFSRRNKSPVAIGQAVSRAWWRWQFKYLHPRKSGLTPVVHIVVGTMVLFYIINYEHLRYHQHYRYH